MGLLECAARCMPWVSAEKACTKQITSMRRLAGLTALDLNHKWWRFGCSLCYIVLHIRRYLCQHGLCLLQGDKPKMSALTAVTHIHIHKLIPSNHLNFHLQRIFTAAQQYCEVDACKGSPCAEASCVCRWVMQQKPDE